MREKVSKGWKFKWTTICYQCYLILWIIEIGNFKGIRHKDIENDADIVEWLGIEGGKAGSV